MIRANFKMAFRNQVKNKVFFIINLLGLSVGIAACLLIFLFAQEEWAYDRQHTHYAQIYRLLVRNNPESEYTSIQPGVLKQYLPDWPDIKEVARIATGYQDLLLSVEGKRFVENNFVFSDSTFFKIFDVEFVKGSSQDALTNPHSIVLSEETARKYFGEEPALGKIINLNEKYNLLVSGIIKDFKSKSHLQIDALIHINELAAFAEDTFTRWGNSSFLYYFLLPKNTDVNQLAGKIAAIRQKNESAQSGSPFTGEYRLQPLSDVYLKSANIHWDLIKKGDGRVVTMLSLVGILILIIACFNYVSLSMMMVNNRVKEVGLKKTLGATRAQLAIQFFTETFLVTLFALMLALLITELSLPYFNSWAEKELILDLNTWNSIYVVIVCLFLFIVLSAGCYPAIFLSGFKPIDSLNRLANAGTGNFQKLFRQLLTNVQFIISISLIVFAIIINNQLDIMLQQNLGFDNDHLLVIQNPYNAEMDRRYEIYKEQLSQFAYVKGVTAANNSPTENKIYNQGLIKVTHQPDEQAILSAMVYVDSDFLSVIHAKLIAGRGFSSENAADKRFSVVLNEAAVKALGFDADSILGKQIVVQAGWETNKPRTVIGIVRDIQFYTLKEPIKPTVFSFEDYSSAKILVRLDTKAKDKAEIIAVLQQSWEQVNSAWPFRYYFLQDNLEQNYKAEIRTAQFIRVFAGLAIFLSCLGILGLAGYIIHQKTKEIAIRIVFGASLPDVLTLIGKSFSVSVFSAFLLAIPLSYYVASSWLNTYAYRTEISWLPFAVAGFLTFSITVLIISCQVLTLASTNAVNSLRNE